MSTPPEKNNLSAKADPVLAKLWDNDRDAVYDRIWPIDPTQYLPAPALSQGEVRT